MANTDNVYVFATIYVLNYDDTMTAVGKAKGRWINVGTPSLGFRLASGSMQFFADSEGRIKVSRSAWADIWFDHDDMQPLPDEDCVTVNI